MDPRYTHPSIHQFWSPEWTHRAYLRVLYETMKAQRELGIIPAEADIAIRALYNLEVDAHSVSVVALNEIVTKHDVAAFLAWVRGKLGPADGRWVHYGLTSSDLVDTVQGLRFQSAHVLLVAAMERVHDAFMRLEETADLPMMGRTHGQVAEPTSLRVRATHWRHLVMDALGGVSGGAYAMQRAKLSGPVGTFAHNPPELEAKVALRLGLQAQGPGASQVIPRTRLAGWASSVASVAAACAKVATDFRLLNMLHQVNWSQSEGQQGSSSMAHKNNPIVAEQICGLARLAQGYASMLQPLDLWLERDISHSCVERVAVPDLWHVVLHTASQTTKMLTTAEFSEFNVRDDLMRSSNEGWVHKLTLVNIADGEDWEDARELALAHDYESHDITGDARWFTRQYPG